MVFHPFGPFGRLRRPLTPSRHCVLAVLLAGTVRPGTARPAVALGSAAWPAQLEQLELLWGLELAVEVAPER